MTDKPTSFFVQDGEGFVPTGLGTSPWDQRSQNGVSLAGLAAHVLDKVPTDTPMLTARMTLDIFGSVPMEALTPATRILRNGPRFQLVETELRVGNRVWVRATMLRVRLAVSPARSPALTHEMPVVPAIQVAPWFEMIRVKDAAEQPGIGVVWGRIHADVVAGHPLSAIERMAMIADFGSGFSPLATFEKWSSANLDITLHLTRLPVGEWLLVDASSEGAGNGIGIAIAKIGDRDGMFANTVQTVFLAPR